MLVLMKTFVPYTCSPRYFRSGGLSVVLFLAFSPPSVFAQSWTLPQKLDDSNTTVTFDLATTWHRVEGKISGISGSARFSDPADDKSLHAEIFFPVKNFDTGNRSRDKELRHDMAEPQHPNAKLEIVKSDQLCPRTAVITGKPCRASLSATLEIREQKQEINLPITIQRTDRGFAAFGEISFHWLDFGIEDPSMIIARVDKTVNVHYRVELPLE